jgi:hypothetical protein
VGGYKNAQYMAQSTSLPIAATSPLYTHGQVYPVGRVRLPRRLMMAAPLSGRLPGGLVFWEVVVGRRSVSSGWLSRRSGLTSN